MPTIKSFDINLKDLPASGEQRNFSIIGDTGCIFSLEVINEDGHYYNFDTETFSATKAKLKNKKIGDKGVFNGAIIFPSVGDDDDYDIYLWAESAWNTTHNLYKEVRFADGSLDINSSTGSNSNLLQKIIYQYDDTAVTIDARSPSYLTPWGSVAITGNRTFTVGRGKSSGKIPFSVIVTTAATRALQINRQPETSDMYVFFQETLDSGQIISGEDIWAGTAASGAVKGTQTGGNGESSGASLTLTGTLSSAITTYGPVGYRITATSGDLSERITTVTAYDAAGPTVEYTPVAAVANGTTITFTAPQYYRWGVTSGSSIHKLQSGMILSFDTGSDADYTFQTIKAKVQAYSDVTSYTLENVNPDGEITETTNSTTNVFIPALDPLGYKPTITNGVVTKQLGNVTFDRQINEDATNRAVWFYAYGEDNIRNVLQGTDVKITDLKVELTKPTTTTTEATTAHATIAVADREGVTNNVSTVSGIGIDAGAANPTITSGGGADGAGDWIMSAVQTLESGITLTVEGTSRVATITGNIEIDNLNYDDFTLYFDLEGFLTAV